MGSKPDKNIKKRILCFSDTHAPAMHPDAVNFLRAVKEKFGDFDEVICNGDLLDFHACARWEASKYLPQSTVELEQAIKQIKPIFKLFPKVKMTWGNHDLRVMKKAKEEGIPAKFLRNFLETIGAPAGWEIAKEYNIQTPRGTVKFIHDIGCKLIWKAVSIKGMNIVQGHRHTLFEVQYVANEHNLHWGATTGCLVDHKHPAYDYARTSSGTDLLLKPIIGCAVIIDGNIQLVPMQLNVNGRWIGRV